MMLRKFACPHCHAVLQSSAGAQVGRKIVCPKCQGPFVVTAPDEDEEERVPALRSSASSTRRSARPRGEDQQTDAQVEDTEGQDDVEIPSRKKKGKKRKRQSAPCLLLPGLLFAGAILLLAGGGVGCYLLFRKAPGVDTLAVASKPPDAPAGWGEVVSAQGRFRTVMPQPVVERAPTMASPVGSVSDTQYLHETDGKSLGYSIRYADFSPNQVEKMSLEQIIDAGRDAIVKQYAGQLEAESRIERDGRHGREVIIAVPGRGRFLFHYYIDSSRLYTLGVSGLNAALDSKEVQAFFDSFRFTDTKR